MLLWYVVAIVVLSLCFTPRSEAAINSQIAFYGTLQDSSNNNLTGTYDMVFSFYSAASGGGALDTSTHTAANGNPVSVINGEFVVLLGSGTGNALDGVDFDSSSIYIGLSIEGDPEMTPRERLAAAPYAFNSDQLDGYEGNDFLRYNSTGTISANSATTLFTITQSGTGDILNVFDGGTEVFSILNGGNIGVGTTTPGFDLTIDGDAMISGQLFDNNYSSGSNGMVLQSTGSGFQWVATSTLGFTGGGSSLFTDGGTLTYLTATNDLFAIGTSSALNSSLFTLSTSSSNSLASFIQYGSGDIFNLFDGSTEVFTVADGGNVGIGSTTPTRLLSVGGQSGFEGNINLEGTSANIALGANYLTGNGIDGGIGIDESNLVYINASVQANGAVPDDLVIADESHWASIGLNSYSDTAFHTPAISFARARGTEETPTTVQDGDTIMQLNARPRGTTGFVTAAEIYALVDGTPSGNNIPAELVFSTRNTAGTYGDRMIIRADGQVGIATSTPNYTLTIDGDMMASGALYDNSYSAGTAGMVLQTTGSGFNWVATSSLGIDSNITSTEGYTITFDAAGVQAATSTIYIADDRNVGIGTTNPLDKLHIAGNILINNTQSIRGRNNSGTPNTLFAYDSSNDLQIGSGIGSDLMLYGNSSIQYLVGGSEYMRLTSAGNLGLRDTTPDFRFETVGTSTRGYFGITSTGGSDGNILTINQNGDVGIGTTTPTTKLTVAGIITPDTDNSFTLGNASYRWSEVFAANGVINTSDRRLKENIEDLEYGLDEILILDPVSFTWVDRPDQGRKYGLIAQDVQEILPDIVNVGDDDNHTLGIRYTELIAVVIEAIQEVWETVRGNQDRIEELEDRIEELEAAMDIDYTPLPAPINEPEEEETEPETATTTTATTTDQTNDSNEEVEEQKEPEASEETSDDSTTLEPQEEPLEDEPEATPPSEEPEVTESSEEHEA